MKVRGVKVARSGLWSDGELLCTVAAERCEVVEWWFRRLAARCYRNGVRAKERADG